MGASVARRNNSAESLNGTKIGTSYSFSHFTLDPDWTQRLFHSDTDSSDILHMQMYINFYDREAELSLTLEYRRREQCSIKRWEQINRRFDCSYTYHDKLIYFTDLQEWHLQGTQFPHNVWSAVESFVCAPIDHELVRFGNVIRDTLLEEGLDRRKLCFSIPWSQKLVCDTINLHFTKVPDAKLALPSWLPNVRNISPRSRKSKYINSLRDLSAPRIDVHSDGLQINIALLPKSRRVSLRVARFGRKFRSYDFKSGKLVSTKGASIPCFCSSSLSIKLGYGPDLLVSGTRYAIKYSILVGEEWSPSSAVAEATTATSSEKPMAPDLEPIPKGFRMQLPALPPNAQHLTLWVLKEGWDEFRVYDWSTKKVVSTEGSAIPVWDTGKDLEVRLEPDTTYTIMYSLMQDDIWQTTSYGTTSKTLSEKRMLSRFFRRNKCEH